MFWRNAAMNGKVTTDSGLTWANRAEKTFGVRVETGPTCAPVINPNPAPGVQMKDMYAKPGTSSFNTLSVGNSGNQTLTLTGGFFTGANASSFRLLEGEPNGPVNDPYPFPKKIGATSTAVTILYIVCDGSGADGIRTAEFHLSSDDPARNVVSFPVWCLVDDNPPSVQFSRLPPASTAGTRPRRPS